MQGAYTLKSTKCPWSVTSTRPSESTARNLSGFNPPAKLPGEPKNAASERAVVEAIVRKPESDRTKVATPE